MTSKTYVKYLCAVLRRGENFNEDEAQQSREEFWNRLTHEERDISAFLGSVSFLEGGIEPVTFLMNDPTHGKILLNEFRSLENGKLLGLLLNREETVQELYQKAVTYKTLTENPSEIPLYSCEFFDETGDFKPLCDAKGRTAYAKLYPIEDLLRILEMVIKKQNDLFDNDDQKARTERMLNGQKARDICDFLKKSGVLYDAEGNGSRMMTPQKMDRTEPDQEEGFNIKELIPYIGWAFAAALLVVLIVGHIIGGDDTKRIAGDTSIAAVEAISHGDDSVSADKAGSEADRSVSEGMGKADDTSDKKKDSKKTESDVKTESEGAKESDVKTEPNSTTESGQKTEPAEGKEPAGNAENTERPIQPIEGQPGSTEPSFRNGAIITNRPQGDDKGAIRTDSGYDLNGNGQTNLYAIYSNDPSEILIGYGFNQNEHANVIPCRNEQDIIGYDTNEDGVADTKEIIDENGTVLGYDFDDDGMCDIGIGDF